MEECKLTKRLCRAAIKESVDRCKNPIALRDMYQIVELLRKRVDDVEYKELSKGDYDRAILICEVMRLEDKEISYLRSFSNGIQEARKVRKGAVKDGL